MRHAWRSTVLSSPRDAFQPPRHVAVDVEPAARDEGAAADKDRDWTPDYKCEVCGSLITEKSILEAARAERGREEEGGRGEGAAERSDHAAALRADRTILAAWMFLGLIVAVVVLYVWSQVVCSGRNSSPFGSDGSLTPSSSTSDSAGR